MPTTITSTHLVPVNFRVGTLHLHQFASNTKVLQGKDLIRGFGGIKGNETKPSALFSLLVVQDLDILDLSVLFEGFLNFIG